MSYALLYLLLTSYILARHLKLLHIKQGYQRILGTKPPIKLGMGKTCMGIMHKLLPPSLSIACNIIEIIKTYITMSEN